MYMYTHTHTHIHTQMHTHLTNSTDRSRIFWKIRCRTEWTFFTSLSSTKKGKQILKYNISVLVVMTIGITCILVYMRHHTQQMDCVHHIEACGHLLDSYHTLVRSYGSKIRERKVISIKL